MTITEVLENNCKEFGDEVCLVEINPEVKETRRVTWREFELIEPNPTAHYRREISWNVFNEKANRFANLLLDRGIKKGDKVAILLMNGLEWLPIYFGILKTGALAVPLNFRYTASEIEYCIKLAEVDILVFGPEFIGRVEEIAEKISRNRLLFYVGEGCPTFAEDYKNLTSNCSSQSPDIVLTEKDDAAIYFSSGTTGFPKAILHNHESLIHSCRVEQKHHGQARDDVFLCIPPLYHTGAKMHWFGSLLSGSKAVLLRGTKPEYILNAVSQEHCTIVWLLVPWAQDPDRVFKTLVTKGKNNYFVFVLPVLKELNLKKAAVAVGEKSVEMIPVKDINKVTGYIRGGCSPVGMKKQYSTVFAEECRVVKKIIVSGGKVGLQIETDVCELVKLVGGTIRDITL